ncbi:DUF456 domain-containing protein [Megalodesulfovibrio gigas]|uniref:Putative membrane protein n=1 Tax=Megalodesulfovibrio gigas (strain ATCC 19364 / DSM 1382 / NCIMB 9332 / VKM B-1759) TaxID=1121448 RepID=T2G7G5_MEGG1|nr:DUF456 domain-containing protein [Megalodesulfovibrio gigas]AGW12129.1 putative membrane protein [Megalodesulfovibrio gigas DSM 1382 = ATCC 19364]
MEAIWPSLYLILLVLSLGIIVFGLPGNWLMVALVAVWKLMNSDVAFGWGFVALIGGIALVGEGVELSLQLLTGRKHGSSKKGNIGGYVGLILGAILGAPILFGLGALPGALLGAYLGCLFMEHSQGRPWPEANRAARGVLLGSFLGIVTKFSLGVVILVLAIPRLFI